jgi:hypothetical protein
VAGSDGSGAGSTASVFGVPPKPGAAYAETLTVAAGIAMSTPATAIFAMLLRAPDDLARVIDRSLHLVPNSTCFIGSRTADVAT